MRLEDGYRILVFAGTTEGREIAELLDTLSVETYVSVATEYGQSLLKECRNVHILCGRRNEEEIADFLREKKIDLVVDATHPFAVLATENIIKACENTGVQYLRCLREDNEAAGDMCVIEVESVAQAVEYLKEVDGNVFISTGSKELALYTEMEDYRERCYVRVLSTLESVEKTVALGFEGEHLIAMQGPFSREINVAMLKHTKAAYFVTKDSGKTGGFLEKLEAAKETGAALVVVGRPKEEGMSVKAVCEHLLSIANKTEKDLKGEEND